ncbi:gamma-glutamylcyclotransferase family protein [Dyella nitratireducens]|uniref:Gamma-glutamylcyclotransferase n=1 Tax=Dyella nitratireducens TaxID=1849580 RepID=A0ABQ1GGZ9_9GAMM|nr:gamma-glutamylcyclotransferase family protein [Dyella nitratireducens]GGA43659.1 gamma-glutamylcyclotransferase [Dyella nitratireducens]GLQ41846.1 gamma-glutamylcyclotransferase [Dyella nitratireducens]
MPKLFSYGTLQQENVQLATFGRRLAGHRDQLIGFVQTDIKIEDPDVIKASGKTHHPMLVSTNRPDDCVNGTVFDITETELAQADEYEVDDYKRIAVTLVSGLQAWVYVDARLATSYDPTPTQATKG